MLLRRMVAKMTIIRKACHLKLHFNFYLPNSIWFKSPHQCGHHLKIFCLGDVAEDKLTNGADKHGQEYPVGIKSRLTTSIPANLK